MKTSVHQLRKQGYKVRVIHDRDYSESYCPAKLDYFPRNGRTIVEVRTPEGKELSGVAECNTSDSYNKKIGVAIALGRALKGDNE